MVNEGAKILEERIAVRASDIDVIWVYGHGWPVYRGGPMFWADAVGLKPIRDRMLDFQRQHGDVWQPAPLLSRLAESMELLSIPWNLVLCAVLGMWLMAAPVVLEYAGAAAGSDQLVGALVVMFAVIGFGEPSRSARWANIPLGTWLLVAPWVLSGTTPASQWNDMAIGTAIILLSLRRGPVHERYGDWDRLII